VEVLAPQELHEQMMGEAKALAESYGWVVSPRRANPQRPSVRDTFADFFGGSDE